MTRSVILAITVAAAVASAGFTTAAINASLTASDGKAYTGTIAASALPSADAEGNIKFNIEIANMPAGSFSGTVVAVDSNGATDPAATAISFSGVVPDDTPNEQPFPTAVTVTIGQATG